MASKKVTIEVGKHKDITVKENLSPRMRRELEGELSADFAEGYKCFSIARANGGVHMKLAKWEEWTMPDLLSEIDSLLERH
jgi:hypothetical protein